MKKVTSFFTSRNDAEAGSSSASRGEKRGPKSRLPSIVPANEQEERTLSRKVYEDERAFVLIPKSQKHFRAPSSDLLPPRTLYKTKKNALRARNHLNESAIQYELLRVLGQSELGTTRSLEAGAILCEQTIPFHYILNYRKKINGELQPRADPTAATSAHFKDLAAKQDISLPHASRLLKAAQSDSEDDDKVTEETAIPALMEKYKPYQDIVAAAYRDNRFYIPASRKEKGKIKNEEKFFAKKSDVEIYRSKEAAKTAARNRRPLDPALLRVALSTSDAVFNNRDYSVKSKTAVSYANIIPREKSSSEMPSSVTNLLALEARKIYERIPVECDANPPQEVFRKMLHIERSKSDSEDDF